MELKESKVLVHAHNSSTWETEADLFFRLAYIKYKLLSQVLKKGRVVLRMAPDQGLKWCHISQVETNFSL